MCVTSVKQEIIGKISTGTAGRIKRNEDRTWTIRILRYNGGKPGTIKGRWDWNIWKKNMKTKQKKRVKKDRIHKQNCWRSDKFLLSGLNAKYVKEIKRSKDSDIKCKKSNYKKLADNSWR